MAILYVEDRNIDAVDSLVDEVEIAEMIEIYGYFHNGSQRHLNINRIIRIK